MRKFLNKVYASISNIMKRFAFAREQSGLVSIIVTMIIMIVLTLIVIGFATISRREQRQALDRQLSTQAFYAAESGVNDAIKALKTPGFDFTKDYTNCNDPAIVSGTQNQLDGTNVQYTCLLVDPSPTSLEYSPVSTDSSTVIPIVSKSGIAITSINLSWQDQSATNGEFRGCRPAGEFPAINAWPMPSPNTYDCTAGVLRIDLVPISGTLSRTILMTNNLTAFLVPVNVGGGTLAYSVTSPDNRGKIASANCSSSGTPKWCNVTINPGLGGNFYYLRVRSIYRSNSLTITANGGAVELTGAQATIDSTGKAVDVLRRVVVHVPLGTAGGDIPDFAISSGDGICKKFYAYPGNAVDQAVPACSL